jgi:hypothetical protein
MYERYQILNQVETPYYRRSNCQNYIKRAFSTIYSLLLEVNRIYSFKNKNIFIENLNLLFCNFTIIIYIIENCFSKGKNNKNRKPTVSIKYKIGF